MIRRIIETIAIWLGVAYVVAVLIMFAAGRFPNG